MNKTAENKPSTSANIQPVITWDLLPPDTAHADNPTSETETRDADGKYLHVSRPTLSLYLPSPEANPAPTATGRMALILIPGGAYEFVDYRNYAEKAAPLFLAREVAIAGLKYRTIGPMPQRLAWALADAQRAVRTLRLHAREYGIDPQKIGVVGFSAGAHLALNLSCRSDAGNPQSADPVQRISCRPDFAGLFCAWPAGQTIADIPFSAQNPPTYLSVAMDDTTAPPEFSRRIAAALKEKGVPVKLNIIDQGGHNAFHPEWGMGRDWPALLLGWVNEN